MPKRRPDARAVFVVPDGSGVWLKSRLRRYSASLRGEWRNGAALRALGDLTDVFAVRAGIDRSRPPFRRYACLRGLPTALRRAGWVGSLPPLTGSSRCDCRVSPRFLLATPDFAGVDVGVSARLRLSASMRLTTFAGALT